MKTGATATGAREREYELALQAGRERKEHLYEVDLVRAVTALCVVGVHATWFTVSMNTVPLGVHLQQAVVAALHFTREVFLSITAFVLVYGYIGRPFSYWTFWRKRGLGVLVPYVLWSLVYVWQSTPVTQWQAVAQWQSWGWTAFTDILTGTASFQLYFILLSLEFYLILPLFLTLMERLGKTHPWRLLFGSALLQAVLLYVDFNYVQVGSFSQTPLGQTVLTYQSALLPLYQFYAVLGGLAALHMERLRAFVIQNGRWVIASMVVGLGLLWLRFGIAVGVQGFSDDYAASVFQPVMVVYAVAVTLFLYWVGVIWAKSRPSKRPPAYGLWAFLSNASFGVYLIHPLVLFPVLSMAVPLMPTEWPEAVRVLAVWALTVSGTLAICAAFLYTPVFSHLIGRPSSLKPRARPHAEGSVAQSAQLQQPASIPEQREPSSGTRQRVGRFVTRGIQLLLLLSFMVQSIRSLSRRV